MQRRRIVLRDCTGNIVRELDVSDIDHAAATFSMTLEVQTQCDLLDWHASQVMDLVPWGRALRDPYAPARHGLTTDPQYRRRLASGS